jgi:precorrin-8X/cobalt-precorrin-8 methylmutase
VFDRIVVVDWSANSTPKVGADSIWIADDDGATVDCHNPATRSAAFDHLVSIVEAGRHRQTLIGVDMSLGYPGGTAEALGLSGVPWESTWALLAATINDGADNRNNRFEVAAALNERMGAPPGPFWGRPASADPDARLTAKRPSRSTDTPPPWRIVEQRLRHEGRRPSSAWQLLGAGSVGSQMLVGIPVVERLRRLAPEHVEVWPFTTGLVAPQRRPGLVVVAEVWPTLVPCDHVDHPVRDARQVIASAHQLRRSVDDGGIAALFAPSVAAPDRDRIVGEEGWILGVGIRHSRIR